MDLGIQARRSRRRHRPGSAEAARALGRKGTRRSAVRTPLVSPGAAQLHVTVVAIAVAADVAMPAGAEAFVDAGRRPGGIDIPANAGGPPPGTFATTTLDAYRAALDLNLLSTIAMCQRAVPGMQSAGWGRVVAITSIGARQPIGTLMASTTARAGVTGFLKVLATEVAPDGVTVNSVQPGVHATDRLRSLPPAALDALIADVPGGSPGEPADFGAVVAFLCSVHARFVTGAGIPVDGGSCRALL
jgi:3-oxoacyl-[acyl-carrier protein] reductase